MKNSIWPVLLGLSLAICASEPCAASPDTIVSDKTRDIDGGRKVLIVIAPAQLEPGIESWNLGAANWQDAVEHAIDQGLLARGRKQIAPLTSALQGYDFDTPMKDALTAAVNGIDWIRAQDVELSHAGSNDALENALNLSNTRQMLLLRVRYETDDSYTAIIVSVEASMLVRKIPKGHHAEDRLKSDFIPYRQTIRSVVSLPVTEHVSQEEAIARWAADGAKLARAALDIGLRQVPPLLVRNLQDDEKSAKKWRDRGDRKTVTRSTMLGWVVGPHDSGVLFVEARYRSMNYLQRLAP